MPGGLFVVVAVFVVVLEFGYSNVSHMHRKAPKLVKLLKITGLFVLKMNTSSKLSQNPKQSKIVYHNLLVFKEQGQTWRHGEGRLIYLTM